MHIESSHRGLSLAISLRYESQTMSSQQRVMDISNMLNPMDEHTERKRQLSTTSMDSPNFHSKPAPVEVGGCYMQPYPTPEHSPVQQYSTTVPASHGPQHGPLPSVNQLLYHPTPPATLKAELPLKTLQCLSSSAEAYHQQRHIETYPTGYQVLARRSSSAGHHTHRSQSPRHRSRNHRSRRAKRDYLHRAVCTPPSTPSVAYLESTTKTLTLAQAPLKQKASHSNEAYRLEHVHWTRYHKIDLKWGWKAIEGRFPDMFASERERVSAGGLSSRHYRDNFLPRLDLEGNFQYDLAGKIKVFDMKVRTKDVGDCKGCPWTFVERHPWAALQYDWVHPEHKVEAAKIVADIEKRGPGEYTHKQKYVLAVRESEIRRESGRPSKRSGSFPGRSTSSFDDVEDIMEAVPSPTLEEIEEDERFEEQQKMEELYKEASQLEFVS